MKVREVLHKIRDITNIKSSSYGSWRSPITSDLIVSSSIGLRTVAWAGETLYWLEGRPQEKGRSVLVRLNTDGSEQDITPAGFNVRTRVHEYGGGAFLITDNEMIYFSNDSDRRVYIQKKDAEPTVLTSENQRRYADFILDAAHNRLICVSEDHAGDGHEPKNDIVAIALDSGEISILVEGNDFYTSPRLSPDGKTLAWVSWDHPDMPWDNSKLWIADIAKDASLGEKQLIAGGEEESVVEPRWSPDGTLYFSSDRSGYWNFYRVVDDEVEAVYSAEAEFGYPHWVFCESILGFADVKTLVCTYNDHGTWKLAKIDTETKSLEAIAVPYSSISYLQVSGQKIAFIGGSATLPTAVVTFDLATGETTRVKEASTLQVDQGYLSKPQPIEFPTENGLTAHAWYYPPTNKDFSAPENAVPPLLVKSHGGPTAMAGSSLSLRIQYWTSRGFAFVDVNYGGSTGYGSKYHQRLDGNWGIVDVQDCVNVAKYLVEKGLADSEKLAIAGGSAGGYTTLAALTFYDTFNAGASYYGISDLEVLATDTHKFEARYLDRLIGKYPEEKDKYVARSPIHFTEKLSCPAIFFQGLEDKVVPPNQAEMMVDAIKAKGLPVAYVPFEGEQHGFRQAANIKKALDSEFYFYSQVFGFIPAEDIEPVEIMNL
ncbi:WD40-like beta Propeller containing protein [[Leptolyngbya] sp. PCC 7376]|uniref:S9 family peptidase n=1 Tax=[Leptolyngbya] sp. PCC 7376 TaxID=111781 RepID=UPI00029EC42F|nr:S9 family peptidase [[Leptolyngbya] sp. PCC 7376]AFY37068.1 WD40-like beta Propeller containing protein [[Leptolyngbya] sp. PCC 7376]